MIMQDRLYVYAHMKRLATFLEGERKAIIKAIQSGEMVEPGDFEAKVVLSNKHDIKWRKVFEEHNGKELATALYEASPTKPIPSLKVERKP